MATYAITVTTNYIFTVGAKDESQAREKGQESFERMSEKSFIEPTNTEYAVEELPPTVGGDPSDPVNW